MGAAEEKALGLLAELIEERETEIDAWRKELEEVTNAYIRTEVEFEISPMRKTPEREEQVLDKLSGVRERCAELKRKIDREQEELERLQRIKRYWEDSGVPQKMIERIQQLL
jgi:hypothetical protein